ncbi:MAG: GAF domain-containing sensor histidine kinase [Anaerolineales bacterium]|nr:GAF domain-containing sensor histidine kinase [Anaerolineales bacterium]
MSKKSDTSIIDRYQRLIEISRDLASTLDLETLLHQIVGAAVDLCDSEQASILLFDQAKNELHFEAATNMEKPSMRGFTIPVDASIAGWIVTNRLPVILSDARQDDRHFGYIAQATKTETKSLLGVPMIHKDRVVGALETINKHSGEFTEEDQNILITLGAQAAVAIENARLFQQSDLISELVHELRTPLASLTTATHLMLRPEISEEQRDSFAKIIQGEITRLSELTTSFLDFARLESGRAQFHNKSFDVVELLYTCRDIMCGRAEEKGLALSVEVASPLPPLVADQDKIKQVLLNLLSNAVKYNQPQGSIVIKAKQVGNSLEIAVSDTGLGMPESSLQNLFQRYYRVPGSEKAASGTGLGLSICKRIIEAHSGSIAVKSTLGKGTTFTINLPLGESTP